MHVLVTGSEGFLGRKLCSVLEKSGIRASPFDVTLGHDILQYDAMLAYVDSLREPVDAVVHLAAVANLNFFSTDAEYCRKINVEGTKNVLRLCEQRGARMLFASTCCCYGNNECHPSTEDSPLCPTEPYARSKAESELDVLKSSDRHVVMRLATFYGAGMRGALCPAIFLDRVHKGLPLFVHGTGKQTRTFTYVDDIASGILAVLRAKDLKYQVFNVSTDQAVSVNEIAELAIEIVGRHVPLQSVEDRSGQIFREEISNERLRSLGWRASVDFEAGMRLAYADYLRNHAAWTQSEGVGARICSLDEGRIASTGSGDGSDAKSFEEPTCERSSDEGDDS